MVPEQHPLRELALFAGAGGGILGGKLLGWRTVCAVEIEPYCREVLMRRQNEGHIEPFPIWDDVRTFDGRPWNGLVDVVSGGFPCQDISVAGRGKGIEGERSGLWREMARIIGEVRPRFAFVENSPSLVRRGLGVVLGDLAALGYDCRWGIVSAADVGALHMRERVWVFANAACIGCGEPLHDPPAAPSAIARLSENASDAASERPSGSWESINASGEAPNGQWQASFTVNECIAREWPTEPAMGRVANGVAHRVDRLSAIGNGQVPRVAATAWRILSGEMQ